jgi:peptidase C39-like protein
MGLWFHGASYLIGLAGMFFLGRRASRSRKTASALSGASVLWLLLCILLEQRQDIAVSLARRLSIGDQVLLLEVWIAWPVVFMLAALGHWLPRRGDRWAAAAMLATVLAVSTFTAGMIAGWPATDLDTKGKDAGICLQTTSYSCGAASAVNFLRRFGIPATEKEMARSSGTIPLRGVTMAGAWWGVEKKLHGTRLRAELIRPSIDDLRARSAPCMLAIKLSFFLNHMVVLVGFNGDGALVIDPLKGQVCWPLDELSRRYQGEAIVLVER